MKGGGSRDREGGPRALGALPAWAVVALPLAHDVGPEAWGLWADELLPVALLGLVMAGAVVWSLLPLWRRRRGRRDDGPGQE